MKRDSLFFLLICTLAILVLPCGAGAQDALFKDFEWRNIGPANMAGRVTDIEAVDDDFATVYVGAASGGVFKSTNAGVTWTPVFDAYGSGNIGDIAIFQPNPNIVWVGTGESCVRNSVGWGDGIYKSTDGGETFTHMGLTESHHIGEVIAHPTDPDIAYVAAQGHLWGHRGDMGIFKTTNGGRTWEHLTNGLPDDGKTGATDIKMDPSNPDVLYAAMWERLRRPYRFDSGGPNGGIYKSTDAGRSWRKLTNGLPEGDTGKIGISIYRKDPRIIVAIVEHGFQPPRVIDRQPNPDYDDMTKLGTGIYRSEDGGRSWEYINRYNNRPFYYSHIYINPNDDRIVYVLAGSASVSEDGGRTFAYQMEGISGDFHALWCDPHNKNFFYVGNDKGSYKTFDNGRTFNMFDNMAIGQFYAVTADNRDPYWVYGGLQDNGNWGGPSNSRDYNGILNDHWFKFHSGDGFHTTVDPNDWRTVYTESQGGNIRRLDAVFRQQGPGITPNLRTILNIGDYYPELAGSNSPRLPSENFRFNWSSPLILSPHNSNTVYFGGNHLFKSVNRGDTWRLISPDLSTNHPVKTDPESGGLTRDVTSAETHCTLITISESPITPGLIWTGTDDGNVHVTRNGGKTWTNVRGNIKGVPDELWVSRVTASRYREGTTFVTFDGHRSDEFRPFVFKTTDFGKTWNSIAGNLPKDEPVYVITEDHRNPDLLFVGTEFSVFASVNGGGSWTRINGNLPTVAAHDLIIHPRENDLIVATHGRSVWILDDISPLQQLNKEVLDSDAFLFEQKTATLWKGVSRGATRGHQLFMGRNPLTIAHRPPGNSPSELQNSAMIHYYLKEEPAGPVTLEIADLAGEQSFSDEVPAEPGVNRYFWNLLFSPPESEERQPMQAVFGRGRARGVPAGPGTYIVKLTVNGTTHTSTLTVREDPGFAEVK